MKRYTTTVTHTMTITADSAEEAEEILWNIYPDAESIDVESEGDDPDTTLDIPSGE